MSQSLRSKIKYQLQGFSFFLHNMKESRTLTPIPEAQYDDYRMVGISRRYLQALDRLHQSLRGGRPIGFWRKLFFWFRGATVCSIVINQQDEVVAFAFSYFRKPESQDKIIHAAYVGVRPQERGKRLAGVLLRHNAVHLSSQGLIRMSGQVDRGNEASLQAVQRAGFRRLTPEDPEEDPIQVFYDLVNLPEFG